MGSPAVSAFIFLTSALFAPKPFLVWFAWFDVANVKQILGLHYIFRDVSHVHMIYEIVCVCEEKLSLVAILLHDIVVESLCRTDTVFDSCVYAASEP